MKIILSIFLFFLIVIIHRYLKKSWYTYRWLYYSITYPFLKIVYKNRLQYLSITQLEIVIDKLILQPDSWFIRKLIALSYTYLLRLKKSNDV
jgi:hypothetical protein